MRLPLYRSAIIAPLALPLGATAQTITPADYTPTNDEQYVVALMNQARTSANGLEVLSRLVSNNLNSITASSTGTSGTGTTWSANFWTSNIPGIASAMNFFQVHPGDLKKQFADAVIPNTPLAWNKRIGNVSNKYNDLVIADAGATSNPHAIAPYNGGSGFADRFNHGGYTGWSNIGENLFRQYDGSPAYSFVAFMIDWGFGGNGIQNPAGHRDSILSTSFRDVGISIKPGYGGASNEASAQHFGARFGVSTLTGIVFSDTIQTNKFYDPGEGIGNVTITATPTGGGAASVTTTWSAGGYALDLANGSYNVSATGSFGTIPLGAVNVAGQNVLLNVVNPVLTIGVGATLNLPGTDYVGNFTARTTAGNLANSGLLNVGATGLVIATATEADIRAQIKSGRNEVAGSPTWTGAVGITSSTAQSDTSNRAVGYVVNGTEITVAQTILGDSNLDGLVNVLDRGTYLANVGQTPRNWQQADWNYDDIVNVLDRAIYLGHVGMSLPTPPPFGGGGAGGGSAGDALGAMSGSGSGTPMLDGPVGGPVAGNTTPGDGVPAVTYDPTTGKLMLDTDGLSNINAIFLPVSPQSRFVTVVGDIDGAAGANWSQFYAGGQNWESALFTPAGNLTMGTWELATMQTGLSTSVFSGGIQFILQNGNLVNTTVEVVPEPTGLTLAAMAGLGLLARRKRTHRVGAGD